MTAYSVEKILIRCKRCPPGGGLLEAAVNEPLFIARNYQISQRRPRKSANFEIAIRFFPFSWEQTILPNETKIALPGISCFLFPFILSIFL